MRLIQGAKTPVVFWLWRSRTQPRKTLRSGRGLKTLDRSTFSSIIEPWKDEGRVLTMVGLIKEKIRPLIDRYFSWIVSIPLYQGLEFSPTWKAQTTFRLTKSLLVNWLNLPWKRVKSINSNFISLPYELASFRELMQFVHAKGEQRFSLWRRYRQKAVDFHCYCTTSV